MTKGPDRPGLDRGVVASGLVVGLAGLGLETAALAAGLIGYAILTAPWFIAISLASAGEFLRFAVGRQIVHRLASDMEAHGGFPGYYPVDVGPGLLPVVGTCCRPHSPAPGCAASQTRNLGFLLGWAIGPLLLLECFRTKLIHYYLPAFPACALLTAWLVLSVTAEGVNIRRRPLGRLAMALLVGIGLVGVVLLVAATTLVPGASVRRCSSGRA